MFAHDDSDGHHSHLLQDSSTFVSQLTRDRDDLPFGASLVLWKRSYVELQLVVIHMPIIDVLHYTLHDSIPVCRNRW